MPEVLTAQVFSDYHFIHSFHFWYRYPGIPQISDQQLEHHKATLIWPTLSKVPDVMTSFPPHCKGDFFSKYEARGRRVRTQ